MNSLRYSKFLTDNTKLILLKKNKNYLFIALLMIRGLEIWELNENFSKVKKPFSI